MIIGVRCVFPVLLIEEAAFKQRDPHSAEVVGRNYAEVGRLHLRSLNRIRTTFDTEPINLFLST